MALTVIRLGSQYLWLCALAVNGERPSTGVAMGTLEVPTDSEEHHTDSIGVAVNSRLHTSTFKDVPDKAKKTTYTLELDTPPVFPGGIETRNTSFASDIRLNSVESHEAQVVDEMHSVSQSISKASTELERLHGIQEDKVDDLKEAAEQKRRAADAADQKFKTQESEYAERKEAYQNLTKKTMAELEIYRSLVSEHKSAEDDYVEAWKTFHRLKADSLRANQEANLALARYNRQEDKIKYWQAMLDKGTKEMETDELELSSVRNESVAHQTTTTTPTTTRSTTGTPKDGAQHSYGGSVLKACLVTVAATLLS